jgi:hypothetical protein
MKKYIDGSDTADLDKNNDSRFTVTCSSPRVTQPSFGRLDEALCEMEASGDIGELNENTGSESS